MRYDNGTLTLDTRPCHCGDGTDAKRVRCSVCNGTGRGARGGANGCKACRGLRWEYSKTERVTCGRCNGTTFVPENWTDDIPQAAVDDLAANIEIVRTDRHNDWVENHLGLGALWTCQDYGRAWNGTDEAVRAAVVAQMGRVQACKVMDYDQHRNEYSAPMAAGIVVQVRRDGYSVKAKGVLTSV